MDGQDDIWEQKGKQECRRDDGEASVSPEPTPTKHHKPHEKKWDKELCNRVAIDCDCEWDRSRNQELWATFRQDQQPHGEGDEKWQADRLERNPRELEVPR